MIMKKCDDITKIVASMRQPILYKNKCISEQNILYKCIYCKKYLSVSQWSILLETYVKNIFSLKKPINKTSGDGRSINGKNIEIKISLGSVSGQFNFVQLRPDHSIDYYIFLCYNMHEDEFGKIYWFLCPVDELYKLLPKYGGYAHGTIKALGKIKMSNIYGNNHEYAIRPNCVNNTRLWNKLIRLFHCDEQYIIALLT